MPDYKFSKFNILLIACAVPFMTLFVSGLSIYLSNRNEVKFSLSEIGWTLSGLFFAVSIVFFIILAVFRKSPLVSKIISGFLVGISLSIWVQSQLLVWNFGQFNGLVITWNNWIPKMIIDGICWIIILGISLYAFLRLNQKTVRSVLTGIYLIGILSIIISLIGAPPKRLLEKSNSSFKDIFTLNPDNNVLMILLDDFQSDYFDQIATEFPDEIDEFDGFTFYRNTISRYPTTKASLPSVLTGALYKNDQNYYEYVLKSRDKFDIIKAYKKRSYTTHFIGQLQGMYPEIISMMDVAGKKGASYSYAVLEYLDYGAFRALPTFFKPLIYDDGHWFFSAIFRKEYPPLEHGADIKFLELFEKNASLGRTGKGSFNIFHFFIPHSPMCVNKDLRYDAELSGESGYVQQSRGAVKLTGRILAKLKELDIYDRSEIIVLSDHGTGLFHVRNKKNSNYDTINGIPFYIQSSAMALLMHKPANAHGKMTTSDAPMELSDLACLLGLHNGDSLCQGLKIAMAGGPRQRTFYYYHWDHEYWKSFYLPPITEYIVSGLVGDPESFSPGNFIYTSEGVKPNPEAPTNIYTLGQEILFTDKGNGKQYARTGWSPPEPYQMWSNSPAAGLSFRLDKPPQKDLLLRLQSFGFLIPKKIDFQEVNVFINQVSIGRWLISDNKWYEMVIPKKVIAGRTINIIFKISNPVPPSERANTNDKRQLGIAIVRMVMEEKK